MDGSRSINHDNPNNFRTLQDALITLTNQFVISSDRALIGMIQFGDKSRVEVQLGSINTRSAMVDAINRMVYQDGETTNTTGALKVAADQFTKYERPGVQKQIMLLTDDPPDDFSGTRTIANTLKMNDITIIVIGINLENRFERGTLNEIATGSTNLIEVTDVDDLGRRVSSDIISEACPGKEQICDWIYNYCAIVKRQFFNSCRNIIHE